MNEKEKLPDTVSKVPDEDAAPLTDSEIIDLYWSRDPSAIVVSSRQYGKYCRKIVWNILSNTEDTEECLNETWFRAWNAMPDARPDYLAAFFGAISRRLALDCHRKNRAWKRGGGEMPLIYDELQDCVPENSSPNSNFAPSSARFARASQTDLSDNNVERHLDTMALTTALNDFLAQLDSTSRILFVRRYWYTDSVRELADSLHFSESRVKSSLFRTRNKLRKYLEKEGFVI